MQFVNFFLQEVVILRVIEIYSQTLMRCLLPLQSGRAPHEEAEPGAGRQERCHRLRRRRPRKVCQGAFLDTKYFREIFLPIACTDTMLLEFALMQNGHQTVLKQLKVIILWLGGIGYGQN